MKRASPESTSDLKSITNRLNKLSPQYPHPIIAREGWLYIAIAVVLALIMTRLIGGWAFPFWIIAVFVLQFFRDPPRRIPYQPNAVLSPATMMVRRQLSGVCCAGRVWATSRLENRMRDTYRATTAAGGARRMAKST